MILLLYNYAFYLLEPLLHQAVKFSLEPQTNS